MGDIYIYIYVNMGSAVPDLVRPLASRIPAVIGLCGGGGLGRCLIGHQGSAVPDLARPLAARIPAAIGVCGGGSLGSGLIVIMGSAVPDLVRPRVARIPAVLDELHELAAQHGIRARELPASS